VWIPRDRVSPVHIVFIYKRKQTFCHTQSREPNFLQVKNCLWQKLGGKLLVFICFEDWKLCYFTRNPWKLLMSLSIFVVLCNEVHSDHNKLLVRTEIHWLSGGKYPHSSVSVQR
jgi:hypothetical protein